MAKLRAVGYEAEQRAMDDVSLLNEILITRY